MQRVLQTLVLLVVVMLLNGCGQEQDQTSQATDPIVVTVGEQQIPLSTLEHAFQDILAQDQGFSPDSSSARRFLNQFIRKTLMEQVAKDSVNWTRLLEHRATSFMENLMVHQMRYDSFGYAGDISEDEVRRVYAMAHTQYRYRAIAFETEEAAAEKLSAIRQGASFESVAEQVLGPGVDTDAGWQTTLSAPESVIAMLSDMAPDEVGGPVEAKGTWFLLQFIEKGPNPHLYTYEESAQPLRIRIVQDRATRLVRAYTEGLKEKYQFKTVPDNIEWITDFFREETKGVPRSSELTLKPGEAPKGEMPDWESCPLVGDDQKRILSTTTVDTIRAILLLDDLISKPSFTWPRFNSTDETLQMLDQLALERLERVEAWEREYDQNPEIAWKAGKRRNLILVRHLMRQVIRPQTQPTRPEVEAYYASKLRSEGKLEERRYTLISLRSEDAAARARELLAAGRPASEVLKDVKKVDPTAVLLGGMQGRTITRSPRMNALDAEVFALEVGQVTKVHPVAASLGVARLEEVSGAEGVTSLEDVLEDVTGEFWEQRADRLLTTYLEERKKITPIQIDEAVFKHMNFATGGRTATVGAAG